MELRIFYLALALAVGAQAAGSAGGSAPATLSKEGDLTTLTLQPAAAQRLQIKLGAVERRAVPACRMLPGEVVLPLAAVAAASSTAPMLGGTLDETLRLADAQAAADGRIAQAQVQVDAAKLAMTRAQAIYNAAADSTRSVEEARAALGIAEAALKTAKAQRQLLGVPVQQTSPHRRLWVRTSIFAGEARQLDARAAITLRSLAANTALGAAQPVEGPATATAATTTIDWYYELAAASDLRPGERVAVEIPIKGAAAERLVVPYSAILQDIHGGQWVYESTTPLTFVRRRVEVERVAGPDAVLSQGPAVGTKVVTDGSAELFGTEFFTGK